MWSQSLRPTSNGPGIADLPCVAVSPISLAYSGSICWTEPVARTASCPASRNDSSSSSDRTAARTRRDLLITLPPHLGCEQCPAARSHRLLDLEALDVVLGLGGIEGLAHHHK